MRINNNKNHIRQCRLQALKLTKKRNLKNSFENHVFLEASQLFKQQYIVHIINGKKKYEKNGQK